MDKRDKMYSFAFRGLLTDVSLEKTEHINKKIFSEQWEEETAKRLGIPLLEEELIIGARKMSVVYVAICAFENSLRKFIENKFKDEKVENWWENNVKKEIRTQAENRRDAERTVRWMTPRGSSPIYYTQLGDLVSIMCGDKNWEYFEVHLHEKDWVKSIITILEKSRNIIMHGGELSQTDIERVGMCIRDWVSQVG